MPFFSRSFYTRVTSSYPPVTVRTDIGCFSRLPILSGCLDFFPFRIQYPRAFAIPYFLCPVINPVHVLFYTNYWSHPVFSLGFDPGIFRADPPVTVRTDMRCLSLSPVFSLGFHSRVLITYPPVTILPDSRCLPRFPVFPVINRYRWMYLKINLVSNLNSIFCHNCHVSDVIVTL